MFQATIGRFVIQDYAIVDQLLSLAGKTEAQKLKKMKEIKKKTEAE